MTQPASGVRPSDLIIPAGGVRAFSSPHAFLDDTGAIVLVFQDATAPPTSRAFARALRRDPASGGWSSAELTPTSANIGTSGGCNHTIDADLDPVTGRLIIGYGIDPAGTTNPSRYQVWRATRRSPGRCASTRRRSTPTPTTPWPCARAASAARPSPRAQVGPDR